eukprot:COSAG05_NODE_731_length_7667_cov_140.831792_4_plen_62_part_00
MPLAEADIGSLHKACAALAHLGYARQREELEVRLRAVVREATVTISLAADRCGSLLRARLQ